MATWSTPSTKGSIGDREDLANFVSMITRDETPFMSSIGKTKATALLHEWQTDELDTPGNSKVAEGTDFSNSATAGSPERTRLTNYTQINSKELKVSGTRRAIDIAGVADEYAYQLEKRGTEMRRDVEYDLVHQIQGSSGSGTRSFGNVLAWAGNVGTVGDTGLTFDGDGTVPTGTFSNANNAAIDLSDVDSVMQTIYEEGGKATKVMFSPKNRREFSDKAHDDTGVRRDINDSGKLRQSVDIYMSDFGDLEIVPNYIMGLDAGAGTANLKDSFAIVYDPMWFAIATLRPMQEVDVGQRGDSTVGMLIEECTLEVKNPKGFAILEGCGG